MSEPAMLPLRPLAQTGLHVTPLCVGCAPLGDMPAVFGYSVGEEQALATIRAALASPIRYIDTAGAYGDGESERRIGLVLRELGGLPSGMVLQTKAGRDHQRGDFSGAAMERSVERSLRLLGLDQLPIVFLHDPEQTGFEQSMAPGGPVEALLRYKDEGVIRHLGVGGGPIELLLRYVETGAFEAVITHNRYTLLNRAAEPLLDRAAARGVAVLNAAPYGGGMLAQGPEQYPRYAYSQASATLIERARRMAALCREHGVPLAAAALQFSLRDSRITSTIVGMSHAERVAQTLELARHPIPAALWPQLDAVGFDTDDL